MSNVVPIRGGALIPILEKWLEQAKRGEIKAMAFAATMSDETTCEGWFGEFDTCAVTMYGTINILRDAYFHDNIEH